MPAVQTGVPQCGCVAEACGEERAAQGERLQLLHTGFLQLVVDRVLKRKP